MLSVCLQYAVSVESFNVVNVRNLPSTRNTSIRRGSFIAGLHWPLKNASEIPSYSAEIVPPDDESGGEAWMPDREIAKRLKEAQWKPAHAELVDNDDSTSPSSDGSKKGDKSSAEEPLSNPENGQEKKKRSAYTEEEEELIEILGGKDLENPSSKREMGFLGDSTLREISLDFQVPICYLADVLCGWGVPPPIDPNGILGDMVTGEQAFAILEAIHTLDVGSLNDRYAEFDLVTLCNEYGIELADGFDLALKEGWNLPFGVRTYLRVEQEDYLIDKFAKDY